MATAGAAKAVPAPPDSLSRPPASRPAGGRVAEPLADVAIAHDYLTQKGGAERVALSMMKAFPSATLYTTLFEPSATYPDIPEHRVVASSVNRFGTLRRHHRFGLPVLASVVSAIHVPARVTLCSSSGWAHGVQAAGRKVVYCYAPARWLYQSSRYLGSHNLAGRMTLSALGRPLRYWDYAAALSAHRYVAISTSVRRQIEEIYGIEADVLFPPVTLDLGKEARELPGIEPGYLLVVSRLLPYKNVAVAVEALRGLPAVRLVVVGVGPEYGRLRRESPSNVVLVGNLPDEQLRWLYRNALAIIAPSFEDFGLTPLEGALAGKPTVALRAGGYLDTVVEEVTGVFFDRAEPAALRQAVVRVLSERWDEATIRSHATLFSEQRFATKLHQVVAEELQLAVE